ncbi:hypothetical protein SLEP1_g14407 [Rubroshorea leprosula]|uniref:Retrotransposon gag domain-containing protein n=1 Tax=Rubroshorea leprosula TaxID=152421 RepID=A0AAV5ITI3_9ROSI|nr:hypothetical protein SLEP1_g14407 [Rubroshorea leprosula]
MTTRHLFHLGYGLSDHASSMTTRHLFHLGYGLSDHASSMTTRHLFHLGYGLSDHVSPISPRLQPPPTRQDKVQSSELATPRLRSSELTAPRHFVAHHVTIIGLTRPRGYGRATWVSCQVEQGLQGPTSGFCRTIWSKTDLKQDLEDTQQLQQAVIGACGDKEIVYFRAIRLDSFKLRQLPPSACAPRIKPCHRPYDSLPWILLNIFASSVHAVPSDPVTAQLNAMQQQFGVFQLVLAQLLARDNPADPLIHLLNPAPPVAPQPAQQPANSPVRSAAPTASQAQSHIPPQPQNPPQPAASDVSRRLDNLEKLLAENKNPQSQVPPIPTSIPTPLNTKITQEPYPPGFRMPMFETYDGTKDPDDHLHAFFSIMQAQNASDVLMCKMFPSTLRGNARTWYHTLRPNSINAYA